VASARARAKTQSASNRAQNGDNKTQKILFRSVISTSIMTALKHIFEKTASKTPDFLKKVLRNLIFLMQNPLT
jgi:hypothetical protein